jgi:hypothetical protein
MEAKRGDHIRVESEKVGKAAREGEILEVMASAGGPHYMVRWADGHESDIRPAAGSATILPTPTKRRSKGA